MKKFILSVLLFCMMLSSCTGTQQPGIISSGTLELEPDNQFGGVYLHSSIDDFCSMGFEYGDSVDVCFSNGYALKDIPFYNGFYSPIGDPLVCAYPNYSYMKVTKNLGDNIYVTGELTEDCTAEVVLHEKGKYRTIQETMNMTYSNNRSDYTSDAEFANFRPLSGGTLPSHQFFRSSSPCNNQNQRAGSVSRLCEEAGICFVIDLADSPEDLAAYYGEAAPDISFWKQLYENGKILPLAMNANYRDPEFAVKTADAMRAILREDGPFLLHCTEGKDRTGFICLLLEALAGASPEEITADYMMSYQNFYGITEETNPESYHAILNLNLNSMLSYLCETENADSLKPEDVTAGAANYLLCAGMSEEEVLCLKKVLGAN